MNGLPSCNLDLNSTPEAWRDWIRKLSDSEIISTRGALVQETLKVPASFTKTYAQLIHLIDEEKAHRFEGLVQRNSMLSLQISRQNVELTAHETFNQLSA